MEVPNSPQTRARAGGRLIAKLLVYFMESDDWAQSCRGAVELK